MQPLIYSQLPLLSNSLQLLMCPVIVFSPYPISVTKFFNILIFLYIHSLASKLFKLLDRISWQQSLTTVKIL